MTDTIEAGVAAMSMGMHTPAAPDDPPARDEKPAQDEKEILRKSIVRSETELREAVEELTTAVKNDITAVKNDITLGARIVEHPTAWLAGGFVVGVLLAWRR